MSFLVAHMQKLKKNNLKGIIDHNERNSDIHSNPDIDISRSHLNYDLAEDRRNRKRLLADINEYIKKNYKTDKAIRKDANLVSSWIISSSKDFFENLPEDEIKRYFKTAKDYFEEKFGAENVRFATVHMDETTPHMHIGIVPINSDGKLHFKTIFNRQTLRDIQEELPKILKEQGFDIERGIDTKDMALEDKPKHLTEKEYKAYSKEKEELEKQLIAKMSEIDEQIAIYKAKKLSDIEQEITKKQNEALKLDLSLKKYQDDINVLKSKKESVQSEIGTLQNYIKLYSDDVISYKLILDSQKEDTEGLKALAEIAQEKAIKYQDDINILESKKESVQSELSTLEQQEKNINEWLDIQKRIVTESSRAMKEAFGIVDRATGDTIKLNNIAYTIKKSLFGEGDTIQIPVENAKNIQKVIDTIKIQDEMLYEYRNTSPYKQKEELEDKVSELLKEYEFEKNKRELAEEQANENKKELDNQTAILDKVKRDIEKYKYQVFNVFEAICENTDDEVQEKIKQGISNKPALVSNMVEIFEEYQERERERKNEIEKAIKKDPNMQMNL